MLQTSQLDASSSSGPSSTRSSPLLASSSISNYGFVEPIALVGMACRLPGDVNSPSELWNMLSEGRSGRKPIPQNRHKWSSFYHPNPARPDSLPFTHGHLINGDINAFDPLFFGISPAEASSMDPQQRKLLEVVFECFESAGAKLEDVSGSNTGCFVGIYSAESLSMHTKDPLTLAGYSMSGNAVTLASNRINYVFNLEGPSLSVDTACSSSMYALHLACQALRNGDCNACIVAGSNVLLTPEHTMGMQKLGVLSPTSMCHAFDASADGFARAEGVNAIYIKPLSKAIKDGDRIRAIIRGTATTSNGKGNGLLHPSADGQERAILRAYRNAGIDDEELKDTAVFECHGTGTPVGDPIEVEAVARVFVTRARGRSATNPLLLGSIKPNIGHGEAASGISSIIKMVLAMEHDCLPPTIGIRTLNPKIDFKNGALKPVTEMTPWPSGIPKRVSINSSGYGGANAHVILEEYINQQLLVTDPQTASNELYLLPFSAADEWSLQKNIDALSSCTQTYDINDLAYTLAGWRSKMAYRNYAVTESAKNLSLARAKGLRVPAASPVIAFVFTGQGAQWPRMGIELAEKYPEFRNTLQSLDATLQRLPNPPSWTIESVLNASPETSRINEVQISQPLCTAIQISLVDLLDSWGVTPTVVIGHSSGEIAAAYASGKLTRELAIIYAYLRGTSVAKNDKQGAMLAISLGYRAYLHIITEFPQIAEKVSYACFNSPNSGTLSGDVDAIDFLEDQARKSKEFARRLQTGGNAYHSHHMADIGQQYETEMHSVVSQLKLCSCWPERSQIPMFSSVDGRLVEERTLGPAYWRRNLESPVLFDQALKELASTPLTGEEYANYFIELGPHSALKGPVREIMTFLAGVGQSSAVQNAYDSALSRGKNAQHTLLELAGNLFMAGHDLDLVKVNLGSGSGAIVDLPKYCWNYIKFPDSALIGENRISHEYRFREHPRHDLLGSRVLGCSMTEPVWRNILTCKENAWLDDHRLAQGVVVPAAALLAMVIEAATQYVELHTGNTDLFSTYFVTYYTKNVVIKAAMSLPKDDSGLDITVNLHPSMPVTEKTSHYFDFRICSIVDGKTKEHCSGTIVVSCGNILKSPPRKEEAMHLPDRVKKESCYDAFANAGIAFGPWFRTLDNIRTNFRGNCCAAEIELQKLQSPVHDQSRYAVHPLIIDACLQAGYVAAYSGKVDDMKKGAIPVQCDLTFRPQTLDSALQAEGAVVIGTIESSGRPVGQRTLEIASTLLNSRREMIIEVESARLQDFDALSVHSKMKKKARQPLHRVQWKPDLHALSPEKFKDYCKPDIPESLKFPLKEIDTLVYLLIAQILSEVTLEKLEALKVPEYLRFFYDWMVQKQAEAAHGVSTYCDPEVMQLDIQERKKTIESLSAKLEKYPDVKMILRVYDQLPEILAGTTTSLETIFSDGLISEVYSSGFQSSRALHCVQPIVDLLAHQNPRMNILEVGAGTGSTTQPILSTLDYLSTARRFKKYTFTDVSPAFFSDAEGRFGKNSAMAYNILDISSDPRMQGFEEGQYDLVVAANVLHATPNVAQTLENCNLLLKPGGSLLLCEITTHHPSVEFLWATLASYWNCRADGRLTSAFIPLSTWDSLLRQAGFNGVAKTINDNSEDERIVSTILTRKAPPEILPSVSVCEELKIVYRNERTHVDKFFSSLGSSLGQGCSVVALRDLKPHEKRTPYLSLIELEGPLFTDISETEFTGVQNLVSSASFVLWVTCGGLLHGRTPQMAMAQGMGRVFTKESPHGMNFTTVDIEVDTPVSLLLELLDGMASEDTGLDSHYIVDNSVVHISRMISAPDLNDGFAELKENSDAEPREVDFDPSLPLRLKNVGITERPVWDSDLKPALPLLPHEVEIQVRAVGINNINLTIAIGMYDSLSTSFEVAGVVKRVGTDVKDPAVGDSVIALHTANGETFMRVPWQSCHRVTSIAESFEALATLPLTFSTAVYGILNLARLQKDETILIQAAAGGTGIASIQIAQMIGAEIYCTVGSDDKKDFLVTEYGIPANHIFNSRNGTFATELLQCTGGKGVDVVQCTTSGSNFQAALRCLAPLGRFIDLGRGDVHRKGKVDLAAFAKSAVMISFDLAELVEHKPMLVHGVLAQLCDMLDAGDIKPLPVDQIFDPPEWHRALQYFGQGVHKGKIVLSYTRTPKDKLLLRNAVDQTTFNSQASYLLVGCQGGVGKSLVYWMVQRGARNLIMLSRSARRGSEFVRELQALAPDITVKLIEGDVSMQADVLRAIAAAPPSAPIRGVLQAAMVLQDSLFSKMTHRQFFAAVNPKVAGTLHLHEALLATPLDFFVTLSSGAAYVGNPSQANYCAANAFQDSLAVQRASRGLAGASIALGAVRDIGYIAQNATVQQNVQRLGISSHSEADVHGIFARVLASAGGFVLAGLEAAEIAQGSLVWQSIVEDCRSGVLVTEAEAGREVRDRETVETVERAGKVTITAATKEPKTAIRGVLKNRLATIFFMSVESLDDERAINDYGLDSLMGAELMHWLYKQFRVEISFLELLAPGFTLEKMTGLVYTTLKQRWGDEATD